MLGIFASRVVRCDYDQVAVVSGNLPHLRSFAPIPIPAASEDRDQPRFGKLSNGLKRLLQGVRGVSVINKDTEPSSVLHSLKPARNRAETLYASYYRLELYTIREAGGSSGQHVIDVDPTQEW